MTTEYNFVAIGGCNLVVVVVVVVVVVAAAAAAVN
jgi:hypothetical protein